MSNTDEMKIFFDIKDALKSTIPNWYPEPFFYSLLDDEIIEYGPMDRTIDVMLAHRLLYAVCETTMTIDTRQYDLIYDGFFEVYATLICDRPEGHSGKHHDPESDLDWISPIEFH